jgi:hypothetical protein
MPDYIGSAIPRQVVKIRLGRFSRYESEGDFPSGAGHQHWNQSQYECLSRVGTPGSNPVFYYKPWQALWIPTTDYVEVPNVLSVKLDKKLEVGGVGTAAIEVENITYPEQAGGYHVRERGSLAALRGYFAHGDEGAPDMPRLLGELGEIIEAGEWEGRFSYAAQITVYQGYGETLAKTFTGLIEEADSTSHPDKIVVTARDFGQVFTDAHMFGWNKDPVIDTPVVFIDILEGSEKKDVGSEASASEQSSGHLPGCVLDGDEATDWRSGLHSEPDYTQYVEISLPEGRYHFADIAATWGGMEVYVALKPTNPSKGSPSRNGVPLVGAWLDKGNWVDLTKKEEQLVPGANGGNSYTQLYENYPAGQQRTPFDPEEANYIVGPKSTLRLSFRGLHATEGGYRAGVKKLFGLYETLEGGGIKAQWVTTEDIADVVRTLCQWAGFKEWDIPDTGIRLPVRLICNPAETYLDVINKLIEGFGNSFSFFMADPSPDGNSFAGGSIEGVGGSLGVPTFRKNNTTTNDVESIPVITDRSLLTAVNVKQSNEDLAYVIRVYGRTLAQMGDMRNAIDSGKRIVYTFRPPWAGTPPTYSDSRLAGVLKQVVLHNALFATPELCRNAAWYIALQEALASIEATVEFPGFPGLDVEDHALLMDLGTGISTRIAVTSRSSTFDDGEKRKWTEQLSGPLIDTPDIRGMVNIINEISGVVPNGSNKEWGNPTTATASEEGYG